MYQTSPQLPTTQLCNQSMFDPLGPKPIAKLVVYVDVLLLSCMMLSLRWGEGRGEQDRNKILLGLLRISAIMTFRSTVPPPSQKIHKVVINKYKVPHYTKNIFMGTSSIISSHLISSPLPPHSFIPTPKHKCHTPLSHDTASNPHLQFLRL